MTIRQEDTITYKVQAKKANELVKMLEFGRLSQGLLHDLMSFLTPLTLYIEKLKTIKSEDFEDSQIYLEKIISISKKITTYMDTVKDSMRSDSMSNIFSINTELEKATNLLLFKARANNVIISVEKNDQVTWFGDRIKLHQIFSNLISNAIDACSETIDRKRNLIINVSKYSDHICISFNDNGIGIESNCLSKIFDPLYTTKTPEKGTGLGLTTVKKILNDIGGTITVDSRLSIGSTFTVSLPISQQKHKILPRQNLM